MKGSARIKVTKIARIFGTKTSVISWIWVSAWNSAMTTPTARPTSISGADTKIKDLKGNTVLHFAADSGNEDLVSAFLSLGLDPREKNREGKRPIDIARERGYEPIVKLLERFEKD